MMLFAVLLCASVAMTQANTRIVGGKEATYGDFPYICSLQNDNHDSWVHTCGSVIWSNDYLITAAHCLKDTASKYRVVCGVLHLNGNDQYRVVRTLSSYTKNPDWNEELPSYLTDIALLKLSSPLTFNSHVNKITFASADSGLFEGESCVLSGWGLMSDEGAISESLQKVSMTAMNNVECSSSLHGDINKGHICFFRGKGYGVCSRDGGGPAVCGNILTGISSWDSKTCDGTTPAVYTRISYYHEWISYTIEIENE